MKKKQPLKQNNPLSPKINEVIKEEMNPNEKMPNDN